MTYNDWLQWCWCLATPVRGDEAPAEHEIWRRMPAECWYQEAWIGSGSPDSATTAFTPRASARVQAFSPFSWFTEDNYASGTMDGINLGRLPGWREH